MENTQEKRAVIKGLPFRLIVVNKCSHSVWQVL